MALGDFAAAINEPANEIIMTLLKQGVVYGINQVLPEDLIEVLADFLWCHSKERFD